MLERKILQRAAEYSAGETLVSCFPFVADHQRRYDLKRLCRIIDMSRPRTGIGETAAAHYQ